MQLRTLFLPLLALLPLLFVAAAKKPPQGMVRFHLQGNPVEGSPFVQEVRLADGRGVFIKSIPEISERDIEAVYPFPAPDGSMGCAFKLDPHGRIALETFSLNDRGKVVVCMLNGRVVTAMLIDRPIKDGVIMMPSGLSQQEIEMIQKDKPTIGQPGKKKRK